MRELNSYDVIFCDIDNTLIYGWFVDFMDWTWKVFHSKQLAKVLMTIEYVMKLYKVNAMLWFMLHITSTPIVFITARCHTTATQNMIADIMKCKQGGSITLVELATSSPHLDKMQFIAKTVDKGLKCCLYDDNKDTLEMVSLLDVDTFDASVFYEEKVN